jgi:hypothetical protein
MKKSNSIRSQVCILANSLKKEGLTQSAAFVKAWQVVKFKTALVEGCTTIISFKKADGTTAERTASPINDSNYTFKGTDRKSNPLQVAYFDQLRQSVRSFNAARFVGYNIVSV